MTDVMVLIIQGLIALLVSAIGFTVLRLVKDLDSNTKQCTKIGDELHALNLALLGNFVHVKEWEYVRGRLHELGGEVQALLTKEELRSRHEILDRQDQGRRGDRP